MHGEEKRQFRALDRLVDDLKQKSYGNRRALENVDWGSLKTRDNAADLESMRLVNEMIEAQISDIEFLRDYWLRAQMTITPKMLWATVIVVLGMFIGLCILSVLLNWTLRFLWPFIAGTS